MKTMAIELTCSCGCTVRLTRAPGERVVCPECASEIPLEATGQAEKRAERPRGLWSVMGQVPPQALATAAPAEPPRQRRPVPPPVPTVPPPLPEPEPEDEPPPIQTEANVDPLLGVVVEDTTRLLAPVREGRSAKAVWSLLVGLAAIGLSVLTAFSAVLGMVPSVVAGFFAVLLGMLALSEIRRSAGRQTGRGLAAAGIVAGGLGMLIGPFGLASLGRDLTRTRSQAFTTGHLTQQGLALGKYHDWNHQFPPGGRTRLRADGTPEGMHGWMTELLPFLGPGEAELHKAIDLNLPYTHAKNLPAMGREVEAYYASGGIREKLGGRFAVAHFAGVGGELITPNDQLAQVGLFDTNSAVTRDAVSDGLSQTLAVGEIADEYPAWGSPENWRQIGRGLNQNPLGFGNVPRTGASFLMADGSVRFFSNKTAPRALEALSTRNGEEAVGH